MVTRLVHLVLAFVVNFILTLAPSAFLLARARLGTPNMHWTEKARRLAPVRLLLMLGQTLNPVLIGSVAYSWSEPSSFAPHRVEALAVAFVAFAAGTWSTIILGARLRRWHDFPPPIPTTTLLRLYLALVPFVASFAVVVLVRPAGLWNAIALDAFAIGLLVLSMTRGFTLRRWLGIVRPAGERLRRAIELASERMQVPPPRCYEVEMQLANAYAVPFEQCVGFTRGALHVLDDEEIASVASHEIAHLHEPRAAHWMRLVTPVAALAYFAVLVRDPDASTLLLGYVGVGTIWFLVRKQKRKLEAHADHAGTRHQGNPGTYALALLRIYRANLFPAAAKRAGTHPMLYDRLTVAGITPDFPRPNPPSLRAAWLIATLTALFLAVAMVYGSS